MTQSSAENRFDPLIHDHVFRLFPELIEDFGPCAWLWIKAQIWQESRMNPEAVSPVGASGLMQLMPLTDKGVDGDIDGADPAGNIDNGVRYLAEQYRHLLEIPDPKQRIRFALASYNGGRGYVNRAMVIARDTEGLSGSFTGWRMDGCPPGKFQDWSYTGTFLADPRCVVKGLRPDHRQMTDYVEKIEARYRHYYREVVVYDPA